MSKLRGRGVLRAATRASTVWRVVNSRRSETAPPLTELAAAVPRMVSARLSGRYQGLSALRLALLASALGYIVLPIDLVPESLLSVVGLIDDMLVLGWAAGALVEEAEQFLAWERSGSVDPARSKR